MGGAEIRAHRQLGKTEHKTLGPPALWSKMTPQHAAKSTLGESLISVTVGNRNQESNRQLTGENVPLKLGKAALTVVPRALQQTDIGVPTQPDLLTLQSHRTETFFQQVVYFILT